MHRFFIANFSWNQDFILKDKQLVHQIINVFRAKVWDAFIFFDGKTLFDFVYKLSKREKNELHFSFDGKKEKSWLKKEIFLFQALPNKLSKIEYILQKWVEVGIFHFLFFQAERSQKLIISPNKEERLLSIMQEALEQSWWNIFPSLQFLDKNNFDIKDGKTIFFHHEADKKALYLKDIPLWEDEKINIIIGPEWGLSEKEVQVFQEKWYIQSYLWSNILRTETVSSVVWFYILQS